MKTLTNRTVDNLLPRLVGLVGLALVSLPFYLLGVSLDKDYWSLANLPHCCKCHRFTHPFSGCGCRCHPSNR